MFCYYIANLFSSRTRDCGKALMWDDILLLFVLTMWLHLCITLATSLRVLSTWDFFTMYVLPSHIANLFSSRTGDCSNAPVWDDNRLLLHLPMWLCLMWDNHKVFDVFTLFCQYEFPHMSLWNTSQVTTALSGRHPLSTCRSFSHSKILHCLPH